MNTTLRLASKTVFYGGSIHSGQRYRRARNHQGDDCMPRHHQPAPSVSASASRRGFLCGLSALPLTAGPELPAASSDLAAACLWATSQKFAADRDLLADLISEEQWEETQHKVDQVQVQATITPSSDLRDLGAKARFCLDAFERETHPMVDPAENPPLDDFQRLVQAVLRDVIALCA